MGSPQSMLKTEGEVALNGWIKIAADGSVVLAMPRSEMGQGVHTALAMLAAEELDVPLSRVRLEPAGADSIYGNVAMLVASLPFHPLDSEGEHKPVKIKMGEWLVGKVARELGINATGGSSSISDLWDPMRMAAATARASLLQAAAQAWKVPVQDITVSEGVMRHASGTSAHYGQMATAAAGSTPAQVTVKARQDWKLIGQPAQRTDIPAKLTGQAQFGADVRLPGLQFAAVRMCPMLGGSVASLESKSAMSLPGVSQVVALQAFGGGTAGLAVVGQSTWHALQGAKAVEVQWQAPADGTADTQRIQAALLNALNTESGFTFHEQGVPTQAEKAAATRIDALYQAPYLAHATMEPMNCTAQVKDGKVEIWVPTQVPQMARAMAAKVAGVNEDQVTVHVTMLGGGFGRRLEVDFVGQAVQVAMACKGAPVQLIWSREEDMGHDFYRPMHLAKFQASLDEKGVVTSLRIKSAGDAITPRWMARAAPHLSGPVDMPDKTTSEGLFDLPYGFASQHMSHVATKSGVPVGFWRSVGHSHNAFFLESFIDELAVATRQDPLAFRLQWLKDAPRYAAVLQLAADKAGWGQALPPGRARGLALHESFGSITAQVAEVSLEQGEIRVHRVVCAIDCGTVVNPGTVAQQVESSVLYGMSAALFGKIDIVAGVVQQSNFPNYPMVSLKQSPVVETHIVPSTRHPAGVGEPAVPPIAPAVANALFALTGKRQRALPLVV
jgi:isoquinoline 1-oxidoreductase beta subunit